MLQQVRTLNFYLEMHREGTALLILKIGVFVDRRDIMLV